MSEQENRKKIDIFTQLTIKEKPLNRRRQTTVTVTPGITPEVTVTGLPTTQSLEDQGCPIITTQILPELALENQPNLKDIVKVVSPLEKAKLLSIAREEEERLPQLIIEKTLLTVWSAEEIRQHGAASITSTEDQGINTINDPRMGTVKLDVLCSTCNKDNIECPGHYGYINLNTPIYHPLFYRTIIKILNCVCNSCGGLFLTEEQIKDLGLNRYTGDERLTMMENASEKKLCPRKSIDAEGFVGSECHTEKLGEIKACIANPDYLMKKSKDTGKITYRCYGDKSKTEYERTIDKVLLILNGISKEDAKLLGFQNEAHPSRFIMQALLVIPPCIRSPNLRDGIIGTDSIGTIYKDIIKTNQKLKLTHKDTDIVALKNNLNFYISQLINNTDGAYSRGKTKFKSIKERIQGKRAAIRGALMGKRVDFTARTIIGPDPSLKFWQIRLPEKWRPFLTREITVTNFNRQALIELLKKGEITHIYLINSKLNGRRLKVDENIRKNFDLQPGDKVDRWAQPGDWVIANRQPTIHKQGMMGHEAVFGPDLTIQIPLAVTTPYNADFDGDEMNLHMVQTIEATAEVMEKMDVRQCVMNAQTNKPIMAPIMDALTAAQKLTQPDVMLDQDTWFDCLMLITAAEDLPTLAERLMTHGVAEFSGKALFSALLPGRFYYEKGGVLIIDGILISGIIDKEIIGASHGSIVQELWKRYGVSRTSDFLTDAPRVLDRWLTDVGFTVGLEDCYPLDPKHKKIIREEVARAKLLAEQFGAKLNDPLEEERREKIIIGHLNRVKDIGGRVTDDNLKPTNALKIMALSGAKGSAYNIAQITTILGQQFVRGQRMPQVLTGGKRASPYFEEGDLDP